MKRLLLCSLCVLLTVGLPPVFAQPHDQESLSNRYFVVIWAYEGTAPRESHTFATFYKGDDLAKGRVRPATISWLSATGDVSLLGAREGRNYSLSDTLDMACRDGKRVASWGPYETNRDLYQRALVRIQLLASGSVAYSLLALRPGTMNCIKATGDITDAPFNPGLSWGFAASKNIVRHFTPFFKDGGRPNKTVAQLTMVRSRCTTS
jgi:hypothetical protein